MSEAAAVIPLRPGQQTKNLYEIGEIPPLGHVPRRMYAWTIRRERHGEPEQAMQVEVVPTPELDSYQVLVMVMAAGVNYNGVWAGLGKPISPFDVHKAPYHIAGSDAAGIVWAVGSKVKRWKVGDEVVIHCNQTDGDDEECNGGDPMFSPSQKIWGYETPDGSFAQFTAVQAQQLMARPRHLTWEESGCYVLTLATAYRMLFGHRPHILRPGHNVLVWGASGGLGSMAIQLIATAGANAIGVISDDDKRDFVMSLGAKGVINRKNFTCWGTLPDVDDSAGYAEYMKKVREFGKAIWEITGKGNDVDFVFEHPGEQTFPVSCFVVKRGGMVVFCAGTTGYNLTMDARFVWMRQKRIQGSHFANLLQASQANNLVIERRIDPCMSEVFAWADIPRAHTKMMKNQHKPGNMAVLVQAKRPGMLIIDPNPAFVQRAVGLLEKVESLRQILTIGPVPDALADVASDLSAEAAKYPVRPLVAADLAPDHIGGLTYTGGTTGKPKGVIGTVESITTMTQIQLAEWEWPANPKFLMCTPLSHAGAAFFAPTLIKGGQMVVAAKFDPAEILKTIEEQRITATMLVPSMLYALMDHPDSRTRDLSSLQTVYYGASAINPVRLAEAIERFGPIFAQYYGQSEAPMVITYLAKGDHDAKRLTSCGRPTLFARTALLGADGQPVPQGEVGEICVGGPLLSGGYWNLPEATAETFRDGWMHTGDMAREDEDGFWFIVDRVKDMIVTGGFNVFPREVEDVVAEHSSVAQVCVIGTPDDKWGEAVTAVVVLRPEAPRDDEAIAAMTAEIQDAVKERKGSVQSPKRVIVVDALPVTALGKPDKKAVRAQFWEGAERAIG